MSNFNCCHCFREIKSSSFAKCANCRLHLHFACIGLSDDQATFMLNLNSTNIKILCNRCEAESVSLNKIVSSIEAVRTSLEERLNNIEALINTSNVTPIVREEIICESVERSLRSKNVILANVSENSGKSDVELANDILEIIDEAATVSPDEVIRLGKNNGGRPRLLKLHFKSVETARLVLKKRNVLKSNAQFAKIIVRDDKSPQQLAYLKQLNSELQERRRNGIKISR